MSRLNGGRPATGRPLRKISPALGGKKPAISPSVVVLPQPEGPSKSQEFAVAHLEVDARDRDGGAVALLDAGEAQRRPQTRSRCP